MTTYQRAQAGAGEVLHSRAYSLPKSRKSYFVTVEFTHEALYIACIEYFVKVQAVQPGKEGLAPKRFAAVSLYEQQCLSDDALRSCHQVSRAQIKSPKYVSYAVQIDELQGKVMWADICKSGKAQGTFSDTTGWLFALPSSLDLHRPHYCRRCSGSASLKV